MDFITWNEEKMGLGIKLIDDQHKELLNIINELSTSINENTQHRDILKIIERLIIYADYHFYTEEELFDKFNYEDTYNHKKEHSIFVEEFIEIKNKISRDKSYKDKTAIELSEHVLKYIIDWFTNHVVGSDKKFVKLFKDNGVE